MAKSSPGVNPKLRFGPILDSTLLLLQRRRTRAHCSDSDRPPGSGVHRSMTQATQYAFRVSSGMGVKGALCA